MPQPIANSVDDCRIIQFDRHHSRRKGDLSVVQNGDGAPFDVKRVFYLYDVPAGSSRGGHAHYATQQLIVAVSGSFCLRLDDGVAQRNVVLNRPFTGVLVPAGIWNELYDFSSGAVVLVMASAPYREDDYIRKYREFRAFRKAQRSLKL
ncbi:MAG: FdtA/QdtA family cupin domain-containing protein [Muribaculaceae bacterium]|nr:FdtA/QdtA family cupin domain-containing protein [Muribaculaceae bacterium]